MKNLIVFISLVLYTSSVITSTNNDLFTLQRKGGNYIDFLNSTKYVGDVHSAINKTILELQNKKLNLFLAPNDSIRYGTSISFH